MEEHRILLVDDDPSILHMIGAALVMKGYQISAASNGQMAIELISAKGFDLVLTEMIMAPIGGLEVLRKTKEISPDTMVIIVTGYEDVHLAVEALKLKADDYLIKPVDLEELFFRVSSCLEKLMLKKRIAEFQENLAIFKTVADWSSEAIAIAKPSGRPIYVNPSHEKLFGLSFEKARLGNCRDLYPKESLEIFNQKIMPAFEKGETWEGEIEAIDAKGRRFPLWQRTDAIFDEQGKLSYGFSLMHDLTNDRQAEEKLRNAQKMEAIGTLAGGIAHEFNNILWILMANIELAVGNLPEGNSAHKNLQRMEKACSRAEDLVQQILSFSRQGEYRPKPLDIMPIVKESLKFLRSSIPTTIEIRQNIVTQSATIMADPSQVHQTLIHLCTNAADAMMKRPGVLEIGLTDVEFGPDETALHHESASGKYVRLSVKDTGVGMEPEVRKRIFEPFFTTKGVGEGRGMGLAVVHGIVKNCAGTIEVHSEPGKGSTFHLFFPKIEKKAKPVPPEFIPSVEGKGRILFVDDDKDVTIVGKDMLESLGYQVKSETFPEEALKTFRDRPDKFDLIITDMIMPGMTGTNLAEELMRIRPDIPVILCTGYHEETYNESTAAIGIKEVLMKPVRRDHLVRAVRKALKEDVELRNIRGRNREGEEVM